MEDFRFVEHFLFVQKSEKSLPDSKKQVKGHNRIIFEGANYCNSFAVYIFKPEEVRFDMSLCLDFTRLDL